MLAVVLGSLMLKSCSGRGWRSGDDFVRPALGVNGTWLEEMVSEERTFLARNHRVRWLAGTPREDGWLAEFEDALFAPYARSAANRAEPQLSVKRSGVRGRATEGLVDWLLQGLGEGARADTGYEARLSAVLRLERLFLEDASDTVAIEAVGALFPPSIFDLGRGDTAHVYVSPPGESALANHTDVADVLVLQVAGSKEWTVCDPVPRVAKYSTCATYDDDEMSDLANCQALTLHPGDLLFVPKRSVHSARASRERSTHLTLGINGVRALKAKRCASSDGPFTGRRRRRLDCSVNGNDCPANTYGTNGNGLYQAADCDSSCGSDCNIFGEDCDGSCDESCDSCTGCASCPAGSYSSLGSASCSPCGAGSTSDSGGSCYACSPGSRSWTGDGYCSSCVLFPASFCVSRTRAGTRSFEPA